MHDDSSPSRRDVAVGALVAGVAATAAPASAQARQVTETDVSIKSSDGTVDAAFFRPAGRGSWPGVIIFADALGLRPVFRDMGRRLAGEGYAVLVPNPFYRTRRAPVIEGPFDFANPTDRAKLTELRAPLTPEAVMRDAAAYVVWLDAQPAVNKKAKIGVQGYCMGGTMTMQASATANNRIGAAASFHGGGLVTDKPDSPHLLVPKINADYYFGVARNDDQRDPTAKDKLREAFAAAKKPAKIEVYSDADHGWCVKGSAVYQEAAAEKAWSELLALYKRNLI